MVEGIDESMLIHLCRAWEMNNGADGLIEFMRHSGLPIIVFGLTGDDVVPGTVYYDEWVVEKSLHKSLIRWGGYLIQWLYSKSHGV
jgi:hypothetical protein